MINFEAPVADKPVGGLLAVVTPETINDAEIWHVDEYQKRIDVVPQLVPEPGVDKQFDKIENGNVESFTIYSGADTSLLFESGSDYEEQLKQSHENGSSHAVEAALQSLILNPEGVDLTPTAGTPVTNGHLAAGILEQWIAERSRTRPIIHTNRLGASLLRDLKVEGDWIIHTKQGTPVANGSGYGSTGLAGADAGADQAWVYVTEDINIYRGETNIYEGRHLEDNRRYVLAETNYMIVNSGPVGALLLGAV